MQAAELDEQLADGAYPTASDALSLRAGQLRAPAKRHAFADALEDAVALAARPRSTCYAPLVRAAEIHRCRGLLLRLAARLREDEVVSVKGLAMCANLLHDGAGPMYNPHARKPLAPTVRSALVALGSPHGA